MEHWNRSTASVGGADSLLMRLHDMRRAALMAIVVFSLSAPCFAEWEQFDGKQDLFTANFPSPLVVEQITWESEYGAKVPARRYVARQGPATYSMTVIDY